MDASAAIEAFLVKTAPETSMGPGPLQDLLFDLWGEFKETQAQPVIERWLTLTVDRHLFTTAEVHDALEEILEASKSDPVTV